MHVPSYQINNVLKVYSKQVGESRALNRQKDLGLDTMPTGDKINLSAEGKRKAVIDKVASDIIHRLTTTGASGEKEVEAGVQLRREASGGQDVQRRKEGRFVYNFIGEDNEKTTSTLAMGPSDFSQRRMTQHLNPYQESATFEWEENHEDL